jgi:hypothetical protein
MKRLFELSINGKFSQYLMPSEVKLLRWEDGIKYTLTPVLVTIEKYNSVLGKNL